MKFTLSQFYNELDDILRNFYLTFLQKFVRKFSISPVIYPASLYTCEMPLKLNHRQADLNETTKAERTKRNAWKCKKSRSVELNLGAKQNCVCNNVKCIEIQSILAGYDPEDPRIDFWKL